MARVRDDGWYDWPEMNNGWYRSERYAQTIIDKEPSNKPVLYDHRGKPLVRQARPVGFRPPK